MGFLDRLFGASDDRSAQPARQMPPAPQLSEDELAIERYRYLLRTAPPESIEAVHAEAFAKLTPEQRADVYRTLAEQAPPGERIDSDEPSVLARAATRAEVRSPGTMERAFGGNAADGRGNMGGPSFGSMFGGSMLGAIAGVVVGSAIAQALLPDASSVDAGADTGDAGADAGSADASGADAASAEASGADAGGYDGGGSDGGGGFGDFGGGDFGGGDFSGGGDFGF